MLPLAFGIGCGADESASTGGADGANGAAVAAGPSEDSAEAAVRYIMDGMKNGQPVVAWNALPERYQTDLNEIVRSFGSTMDPEVWGQATGLVSSVHELLETKRDFFLGNPMIAEGGDPEKTKEAFTQVTAMLKTLLDSAGDLEKLKTFDGGEFMSTSGAQFVAQIDAVSKMAPPGSTPGPVGLAALENATVETLESTDTTATLKITSDGQEQTEQFVKVDGKWIPESMAKDWDQKVAEAKASIAELPSKMGDMRMGVTMASGMVNGALTPLKSAETQEQFNSAMDGLRQSAMGLMMGGMGGMGGPPPPQFPTPPAESGGSQNDPIPEPAVPQDQ